MLTKKPYTVLEHPNNGTSRITVYCPMCKNESQIFVSTTGYNQWTNGTLIQHALPSISLTNRETLISGLCGKCQALVFGGRMDEDDSPTSSNHF